MPHGSTEVSLAAQPGEDTRDTGRTAALPAAPPDTGATLGERA